MKEDKKNLKSYWILGIFGIIFVAIWSYFDPGDRILFPDKTKLEQKAKTSINNDTTKKTELTLSNQPGN